MDEATDLRGRRHAAILRRPAYTAHGHPRIVQKRPSRGELSRRRVAGPVGGAHR